MESSSLQPASLGPYRSPPPTPPPPYRLPRIYLAALAIGAVGILVAFLARTDPEDALSIALLNDVPEGTLDLMGTFPPPEADLPPATPLAPLLVADAPESAGILSPSEGATRVRRGGRLSVRFNRPMVLASQVGSVIASDPPILFDPAVTGAFRWVTRSTLSFEAAQSVFDRNAEASFAVAEGLASLDGEELFDDTPRVAVFDGTPRIRRIIDRVSAGSPLSVVFDARVSTPELTQQMFAYEMGGGFRPVPVRVGAARYLEQTEGRAPEFQVDLQPLRALEPGARIAVAIAPRWEYWGGSHPSVLTFQLEPRPRIIGIGCEISSYGTARCTFDEAPGEIVDIGPALRLRASTVLGAPGAGAVRIAPPLRRQVVHLEGTAGEAGQVLTIEGEWEPDQVYEVRFGDLRTAGGERLVPMTPLAVRSAGHTPYVSGPTGVMAWETGAPMRVRLRGVHIDTGAVLIRDVPPGSEAQALLHPSIFAASPDMTIPLTQVLPDARPNRFARGELDLTEAGASAMAVVGFAATEARGPRDLSAAFVQRSDLAISAQALHEGVLVWVTSTSAAAPVRGARVALYDERGEALATGETDEGGAVWLRLDGTHGSTVTYEALAHTTVIVASANAERAAMALSPGSAVSPGALGLPVHEGTRERSDMPLRATVVPDRGAYRPGEVLHALALVRRMEGDTAHTPAAQAVVMRVMGDSALPVVETATRLVDGRVDASWTLPDPMPLGNYRVEIANAQGMTLASESIRVAEFRQPRFRVDVPPPPGTTFGGAALSMPVRGRYLFGAALAEAEVQWTLSRTGTASFPARYHEYRFGPLSGVGRRGTIAEGQGQLDREGELLIPVQAQLAAPIRTTLRLEAEVRDSTGETLAGARTFTVYPAAAEAGVRGGDDWVPLGQELTLEAIAVDAAGELAPNLGIEGRFVREGWHGWWEWSGGAEEDEDDDGYRLRRTQGREVVSRCSLTSAAEPASCGFTPTRPGTYVLEVELRDAEGRVSLAQRRLYVAGPDESPDRDPPGAPIAITPSRELWTVGEEAELAFESPWPDAEALITVHQGSVISVEQRRVAAGSVTLRVPLTREMVPNVFVTVTLVRPRDGEPGQDIDLHAPDLRFGSARLVVRPAASQLSVDIENQAEARPGVPVEVAVQVRDAEGAPVAGAQVALWAVDEGTLRLTGYQAPNPTEGFFVARVAEMALEDLRRLLVSRIAGPIDTEASGDGSFESSPTDLDVRERFDPTPLWAPRLTTGADGRVTAHFETPDRATEYRVMAVVLDQGLRAGRAGSSLVVSRPLVARGAFPRFATEGDRFEAAAYIHNATDAPLHASVRVRVGSQERGVRELDIPARGEARVAETVEARGEEPLEVRFEASGQVTIEGVTEAASHEAIGRVPIVPRARWLRRRAVIGGATERALTLEFPAGTSARGEVRVAVSAHPFVGLEGALEALDESWWMGGDVEASRLLAIAAWMRLDPQLRTSERQDALLADRASRAVSRVLRMRTGDGGFAHWSPSGGSTPQDTVLSVRALVEARAAGLATPSAVFDEALERLDQMVRGGYFGESYGEAGRDGWAMALRLLGQSGRSLPQLEAAFAQREFATPYQLAQFAMAMPSGDARAETLLLLAIHRVDPQIEIAGIADAEGAQIPSFARDVHQVSAVLEAAAELRVGRPYLRRLATEVLRLSGVRARGYGTPMEIAESLAALRACAARFGSGDPMQAALLVDGRPIEALVRADSGAGFRVPFADVARGTHRLVARGNEDEPVFVAIDARWAVPIGEPEQTARGRLLSLHRVYETPNGTPLPDGAHVRLGDMVRVRVYIHTERSAPGELLVRDPLPAGFDAVDSGMETTPRSSLLALLGASPEDDAVDPRGYHAQRTLSYVSHRQLDTHAVTHVLGSLPSGLHEITYALRATTPGTFTAPPTQLEAMRDEDWVARSTSTTLVVDR